MSSNFVTEWLRSTLQKITGLQPIRYHHIQEGTDEKDPSYDVASSVAITRGKRLDALLVVMGILIAGSAGLFLGITVSRDASQPHQSTHNRFPSLEISQQQNDFLLARPWNYSTPSPCGHTPNEARAAGCRWSPMTFAWYPAACYDEELDHEFLSTKEWEWFSTEELLAEDRLPRDAILRGDIRRAFMSMDYHKLHCMYTVRKLYRAVFGLALSDTYILTIGHLHHCEEFVLRDDSPAVKGVAKYLDCVDLS